MLLFEADGTASYILLKPEADAAVSDILLLPESNGMALQVMRLPEPGEFVPALSPDPSRVQLSSTSRSQWGCHRPSACFLPVCPMSALWLLWEKSTCQTMSDHEFCLDILPSGAPWGYLSRISPLCQALHAEPALCHVCLFMLPHVFLFWFMYCLLLSLVVSITFPDY